jgi:putative nucleotidyltransferase with HDIG domain
MNDALLEEIRSWFVGYAADHLGRGRLPAMMQLKIGHSERVAREARSLADELGWTLADQNTAEALGLLHDVGRFSQLEEFGTFRDRNSVNHAVRGHEVVSVAGVLRPCPIRRQHQILDGILYHNVLQPPAEGNHDSQRFVRLIRDADKLDIYAIFLDAIMNRRLHEFPEIVHGVDLSGPVNPALLDSVLHGRVPHYNLIHSLNDWLLIQLSWVYDLSYNPSFRRLLDRRVLDFLAARLPDTADVRAAASMAITFAREKSSRPDGLSK